MAQTMRCGISTHQLNSSVYSRVAPEVSWPFAKAQASRSSMGVEKHATAFGLSNGFNKFFSPKPFVKPVLAVSVSSPRNDGSRCEYALGLYEPMSSTLLVAATTSGLISTVG